PHGYRGMSALITRSLAFRVTFGVAVAAVGFGSVASYAQSSAMAQMSSHESMGMGDDIFGHCLFNQLEGRTNGPDNEFRWDGEGWIGTDMNRLWFKSEGFVERGLATDGDQEALYDRPITTYFDAQAGVRYDLDS